MPCPLRATFPPSPGVSLDLYRSLLCSASALPPAVYCEHKIFNKGKGRVPPCSHPSHGTTSKAHTVKAVLVTGPPNPSLNPGLSHLLSYACGHPHVPASGLLHWLFSLPRTNFPASLASRWGRVAESLPMGVTCAPRDSPLPRSTGWVQRTYQMMGPQMEEPGHWRVRWRPSLPRNSCVGLWASEKEVWAEFSCWEPGLSQQLACILPGLIHAHKPALRCTRDSSPRGHGATR